jgi:hypothetical protein
MALLESSGPQGRSIFELPDGRTVIGRSSNADLVIDGDKAVSRWHADIERVGGVWVVRDLDSANGTEVNGEKIFAPHPLRIGDEIRVGDTSLCFRGTTSSEPIATTDRPAKPPNLTVKQRQVLIELTRPQAKDPLEPCASVKEIAEKMFVGEAAVKAHLAVLYEKFDVPELGAKRRPTLAKRAWETGAVRRGDFGETVEG